jgi:hypothetical protein
LGYVKTSQSAVTWSINTIRESIAPHRKFSLSALGNTVGGTSYTSFDDFILAKVNAFDGKNPDTYLTGIYYLSNEAFTDLPFTFSSSAQRWIVTIYHQSTVPMVLAEFTHAQAANDAYPSYRRAFRFSGSAGSYLVSPATAWAKVWTADVGSPPPVYISTPFSSADKTTSPIIVQNSNPANYNQGIRINVSAVDRWAGLIIGGRPGSLEKADPVGYAADQTDPATRNGTWWVSSNPAGDLEITQIATSLPSTSKGIYVKRTGEVFFSDGARAITDKLLTSSIVTLNATQLGLTSADQSTASTYAFRIDVPANFNLKVNTLTRTAVLSGWIVVGKNFTGCWGTFQGLYIPSSYLPLDQNYLMMAPVLDNSSTAAPGDKSIWPCDAWLELSNKPYPTNVSFNWRIPTFPAGKYAECFINMSWMF